MKKLSLYNTSILLKFINCIERVLFIDNKWMKDYADLMAGVQREYKGIPLYLKKILDAFEKAGATELVEFKPKTDEIYKTGQEPCIILEALRTNDSDESSTLVVVACPNIERLFHFKYHGAISEHSLNRATINDFFSHPNLPRIRLYSRNFQIHTNKVSLSELKFLYLLLEDSDLKMNSLLEADNKLNFRDIIPDPSLGVQVGSLGSYYVTPVKLIDFKPFPENLHQIILIAEDWRGNQHEIHIETRLFRETFKSAPSKKFFESPRYVRALIFQEFCESFKHVLFLEESNNVCFMEDSLLAYVRFRVNVRSLESLPYQGKTSCVFHRSNVYSYFGPGIEPDDFESWERSKIQKSVTSPSSLVKIYKMNKFFQFNPHLKEIYLSKTDASSFLITLEVKEHNPVGIHKRCLSDPVYRMQFYAMNKRINIFCTYCREFDTNIRTGDIPDSCPKCGARILVRPLNDEDKDMLKLKKRTPEQEKRFKYYFKLGGLYMRFGKYLYFVWNASERKSITHCVELLTRISSNNLNTDNLFKKLYYIQKEEQSEEDAFELEKDEIEEIPVQSAMS